MSGSVFDFNESPLSNRVVIAVNTGSPMAVSLRSGGNPAPETTQELAYAYTKSDGSYMIYVQNPGQYQLSMISTNNKEIISPSVQMVSVSESNLIATPAAVDESFTVISGFKVTGTVYDGENPKGGINILFYSTETEESYTTMSAPDGKYIVYVPAGTYQVSVAGGYNVTSPTALTINSDTSNFSIVITAGEPEYDN